MFLVDDVAQCESVLRIISADRLDVSVVDQHDPLSVAPPGCRRSAAGQPGNHGGHTGFEAMLSDEDLRRGAGSTVGSDDNQTAFPNQGRGVPLSGASTPCQRGQVA